MADAADITKALEGRSGDGWAVVSVEHDAARREVCLCASLDGSKEPVELVVKLTPGLTEEEALKRLGERMDVCVANRALLSATKGLIGQRVRGWVIDNVRWPGMTESYYVVLNDGGRGAEVKVPLDVREPEDVLELVGAAVLSWEEVAATEATEAAAEKAAIVAALKAVANKGTRSALVAALDPRLAVTAGEVNL